MNDTNDMSERDLVRDILNTPSQDKSGNEMLMRNGRKMTNKGMIYYGLVKAAAKGNTKAAELLLKQGGMIEVDAETKESPEEAAKRRRERDKKIADRLRYYTTKITDILKDAGVYEARLCFQIEVCATSLMSYRKMRLQYLDPEESCYIVELSREGTPRKKPNPLAAELRQEGAALTANLAKLTMNIKDATKKADADDKFSKFLSEFGDEDE